MQLLTKEEKERFQISASRDGWVGTCPGCGERLGSCENQVGVVTTILDHARERGCGCPSCGALVRSGHPHDFDRTPS